MKNTIFGIAVSLLLMTSCSDYLNHLPTTSITYEGYFTSEAQLQLYANGFNTYIPGAGLLSSDLTSDNIEVGTYNATLAGVRTVPASGGGWNWTWLRQFNILLENYRKADCDESVQNYYAALARFYRAWFYYEKVKAFGDVPWYDKPLQTNSEGLYQARDPREDVDAHILEDLDFAIKWLSDKKDQTGISRWTALALKSRFCLYEGTYYKYHTELNRPELSKTYLEECVRASDELMSNGGYKVYDTGKDTDYRDMFISSTPNSEVILAKMYSKSQSLLHSANYLFLVASASGKEGYNKQFVDSYLMRDGSYFSDQAGYATMSFSQECRNRDLRMQQTMRTPGYKRIGGTSALLPDFERASTGYQSIKWVGSTSDDAYNGSYNAIPIFRYSEVLLNYAEAKAELGTITQDDIRKTIDLTRARGGLPAMKDISSLKVDPTQQKLYPDVNSAVILEIRRERRVELVMEGLRWDDLMRWKKGPLMAQKFKGMYFESLGIKDLDGDGVDDFAILQSAPAKKQSGITYVILDSNRMLSNGSSGYIIAQPTTVKSFDEDRDYLYPIPTNDLVNNKNLKQNPGWE